jgi:hypothetical protein
MRLFDAYIFVDWSSRNGLGPAQPTRGAIWIGELAPDQHTADETYCRGRQHAVAHLRERLHAHVRQRRRVLVGFDFPYGYPAGLTACLGISEAPRWRAVWDLLSTEIADDERNRSNRFEVAASLNERLGGGPGPFWGCPGESWEPQLTRRMLGLFEYPFRTAAGTLRRLRLTEEPSRGVQETWKLAGAGSVGSQALVGIPWVRSLRDDPGLAGVSVVWPFETGFTSRPAPAHGPRIVHAEIWPGIIPSADVADEVAATGAIRDQAQVRLMCRWAGDEDRKGALGAWFDTTTLDATQRRLVVEEEGWILGFPA